MKKRDRLDQDLKEKEGPAVDLLRRVFCCLVSAALLTAVLSLPGPGPEEGDGGTGLSRFAREKDAQYAAALAAGTAAPEDPGGAAGLERLAGLGDFGSLEEQGIYVYSSSSGSGEAGGLPPEICFTDLTLFYSAALEQWGISMSGYWKDPADSGAIGAGDVGRGDFFGIEFSDTYGSRPILTGMYSFMCDERFGSLQEGTSRASGDTRQGVTFGFQDKVVETADGERFSGAVFGAVVYFTRDFENFHGTAVPFLTHTWDVTVLSIPNQAAGLGGLGFDLSLTREERSVTVYGDSITF